MECTLMELLHHKVSQGVQQFCRSKRLLPPLGQMKNLRNPFHFRRATPVSYSFLEEPLERLNNGSFKVPLLAWHENFNFKKKRAQDCFPTLVLNFSQDFSVLICIRQYYQGFGKAGHLCDRQILLRVTEMPFRLKQKQKNTENKGHSRPKYLRRKMPTWMFFALKYLDSNYPVYFL